MKKPDIEIIVGLFIFFGILTMAYVSFRLGRIEIFKKDYYPVKAIFTNVKGLKNETDIEIAGVKIGNVKNIELKDYRVVVTMLIKNGIDIQDDAIASIRTKGLLGDKYIEISPGGSDVVLKPGETLFDTEPAFDLESVIKKAIVEKKNSQIDE